MRNEPNLEAVKTISIALAIYFLGPSLSHLENKEFFTPLGYHVKCIGQDINQIIRFCTVVDFGTSCDFGEIF
jgi:hypothetical protein